MKQLRIQLKTNSYNIFIADDILFHLSFYIKEVYQNKKIYIITDDNVEKLYLEIVKDSLKDYEVESVIVPHGEASKSIEVYTKVVQELLDKDIHRNELLLALGGGVIGDLTGFVAATLYRGLPYVSVPTSLLSQMDSSIGGKTGIDFYERKNILGCFKQPILVLIDPKTLHTLSKREWNNGMGELIKHAAIGNKKLFEMLKHKPKINEEIIYQSLSVKKNFVEKDEFDTKERMLLNFGHTFGHAIELKLGLKHGEAVALGMLMVLRFGITLGLTEESCYIELKEILKLYDLPSDEPNYKEYLLLIAKDKKNLAGKIQMVFLSKIGQAFLHSVEEEHLKELI
ncbi:MAG: 3-dehydroquinate synthase [Roseburia sp.]|nr:3-dehydroquinate synthase [Anaeroplasma bactoclasticum]MCM1196160.1 3-dehydroquinate synthase [Roseburia sp.]MCM1556999.1 3-dehydroquinate synthase [Anaeroplasma bactoclasticum]